MSTRWYTIYQRGNPQLRVFLPNFWLKLIKPTEPLLPNVVQFIVSTEMTRLDVKNYIEKIYQVPVVRVSTRIAMGKTRREQMKGYVIKDDDYKIAYVSLPRGTVFNFPDLFPEEEDKKADLKQMEKAREGLKQFIQKSESYPGLPGWLSR